VEAQLRAWWSDSGSSGEEDHLRSMWQRFDSVTEGPALELCETLRLVLEPTKASKMKGGYASGKRINMRAVIPYIASGFKKDKIWLRRTQLDKRNYQIIVAIDDSESMKDSGSRRAACESLLVLNKALERLQVGQVAVVRFGEEVELLKPFEKPYNADLGAQMLGKFTFSQKSTDMLELLKFTGAVFDKSGGEATSSSGAPLQLMFVISDGIVPAKRSEARSLIRQSAERGRMCASVIIDPPAHLRTGEDAQPSIFKRRSIDFVGSRMVNTPYLDHYPCNFYTVLQDVDALPAILADALRQWYEMTLQL